MLDLTTAHPDVLVLVGTQTGNSEIVADAVAERLGALGFAAHLLDMAEAYPEVLGDYRQIVAVTCTWSEGTFPDNAVDFIESLDVVRPDLEGVRVRRDRARRPGLRPVLPDGRLSARRSPAGLRSDRGRSRFTTSTAVPTADDVAGAEAWAERCARAFAATGGAVDA